MQTGKHIQLRRCNEEVKFTRSTNLVDGKVYGVAYTSDYMSHTGGQFSFSAILTTVSKKAEKVNGKGTHVYMEHEAREQTSSMMLTWMCFCTNNNHKISDLNAIHNLHTGIFADSDNIFSFASQRALRGVNFIVKSVKSRFKCFYLLHLLSVINQINWLQKLSMKSPSFLVKNFQCHKVMIHN